MNEHYGATYRGKRIDVICTRSTGGDAISCAVSIDGASYPGLRGNPFASPAAAQVAGVAFARAMIDTQLDSDLFEHHGYFIRVNSTEQLDGAWVGNYQLHRNDNPVAFRRVVCEQFRGNSSIEAEEHAIAMARLAVDADISSGRL